ncbi:hypothetical protein [Pseudoalteromonas viridis]|uniref:Secreted protein n=1 Tax=Pseudoalteromonas viridis TaxID=339617 RepID=A0ABX7V7L5_9GAMM|nr:hypothetical protein [Pseudoalteromonas viridis]QTL35762.1 hypothetical protein J5X90_01485 [Pseudoalteromonas viridis]
MIKKVITGICALLMTTQAFADKTKGGKIDSLYVGNYWTQVHISRGTLAIDTNHCGDKSKTPAYFAINTTHPNYNVLHSTLMAAQFANKTVKLFVDGDDCAGQNNNYPRITHIWVTE